MTDRQTDSATGDGHGGRPVSCILCVVWLVADARLLAVAVAEGGRRYLKAPAVQRGQGVTIFRTLVEARPHLQGTQGSERSSHGWVLQRGA